MLCVPLPLVPLPLVNPKWSDIMFNGNYRCLFFERQLVQAAVDIAFSKSRVGVLGHDFIQYVFRRLSTVV